MADKKPTKRENFQTLLVILGAIEADEPLVDFVQHEIDLLDKKSGTKSPNKAKLAGQESVMEDIVDTLANVGVPMSATDIGNGAEVTVQKASSMLRKMVEAGTVIRHDEKGKATFSLPE